MDEWERLEREATAGPWRDDAADPDDVVIWGQRGTDDEAPLIGNVTRQRVTEVGVVLDADAANARLITFLRNRSPQLRALVEAAREASGGCGCKPESGCCEAKVRAALKALDEVGHA